MAGFTSEEVQTKINQFLRTQITVGRTRSGSRDILALRDEAFDLLTTSILIRPDSFFYIVSRAVNRFEALRRKQVTDIETILAAFPGVTRRGVPIESTAELVNAQAALLEINAGLNTRQTGSGIRGSIGPGVERFQRSTERFLRGELVPNIVDLGTIVETGDELRATITATFADVSARHAEMLLLADNLVGAIAELDAVRLPEQSVQGIVGRISDRLDEVVEEMGGTDALSLARGDALDLFVMRVLLARSSSFRTPLLTLAPLTGDGSTMTLTVGVTPGEILGTVSGPYNYGSIVDLDLETGSGGVLPTFASPGDSRATIATGVTPASLDFGAGGDVAISVQGGAPLVASFVGLTTRVATASGIDTALGVAGAAFVSGTTIVIQSADETDASSLELDQSTAVRLLGVAVLAPLKTFARSESPSAQDIADALLADPTYSPHVDPEVLTTDLGSFTGNVTAVVAEEDLVFVTGVDFSSVPAGARLQVTNGDRDNIGYYRVLVGGVGQIQVDRDFNTRPDDIGFNIFTQFLKLKATAVLPTDGIRVVSVSIVSAAIGLPLDPAINKGLANTGTITTGDLLERGVRVGDLLLLDTDTPETARELTLVDRQIVTFSPGFEYDAGATTIVAYSIRSQRYQLYRFLIDGTSTLKGIQAWLDEWRDFSEMDRVVGQIIRGGIPLQATPLVTSYLGDPAPVGDLTTLGADVAAFDIPFEPTIDNILRLLAEQGMDRALELLVTLELITFFTMPAEGVSFSTWLTRQAADSAREIAPVSKFGQGDKVAQEMRLLASQPDPYDPDLGEFNDFLQSDNF